MVALHLHTFLLRLSISARFKHQNSWVWGKTQRGLKALGRGVISISPSRAQQKQNPSLCCCSRHPAGAVPTQAMLLMLLFLTPNPCPCRAGCLQPQLSYFYLISRLS